MKSKLIIIGLILVCAFINAQTEIALGYIIKQTGDTLYGNIEVKSDRIMGAVCYFQPKEKDFVLQYTPKDIRAYGLTNGDYYASKSFESTLVFMKPIGSAKNMIWYLDDKNGMNYYIAKRNGLLSKIPYSIEKENRDGKLWITHSNSRYKLKNSFETDGLAMDNVTNFRKAISIEMSGGALFDDNSVVTQTGILFSLCDPTVESFLYLRTGIQKLDIFNPSPNTQLRIPLQAEARLDFGQFVPKVALGVNFYTPFIVTASFMVGVNFQLNKTFSWAVSFVSDYLFEDVISENDTPYLNSISTGLIISF